MVTLHEVITFLVSMQISISSLQTHNVNRCGRSRHLARKLSLRRKRSSQNVFERSEERFSRNAETDIVCRLLLEKKKVECCVPQGQRLSHAVILPVCAHRHVSASGEPLIFTACHMAVT